MNTVNIASDTHVEGRGAVKLSHNLRNDERQYVTFSIGSEIYGIEVMRAREVMYLGEITHVPNTLPYMKGVFDLRGTIVPLVDTRIKFKLDPRDYDLNTVIILIEYPGQLIGLIVDSVQDVMNITPDQIQDPAHFAEEGKGDYVKGITKIDGKLIIVLDVDRIFTKDELHNMSGNKDE